MPRARRLVALPLALLALTAAAPLAPAAHDGTETSIYRFAADLATPDARVATDALALDRDHARFTLHASCPTASVQVVLANEAGDLLEGHCTPLSRGWGTSGTLPAGAYTVVVRAAGAGPVALELFALD